MFRKKIDFQIQRQPTDITCGPTCLHSVYQYYGKDIELGQVISEVKMLKEGGTLAPKLGQHGLDNGFDATIFTFNLFIFDPTWFALGNEAIIEKLKAQSKAKDSDRKFLQASNAYKNFIKKGGQIVFDDLSTTLLAKYLSRNQPIIAGLSATYLYKCARELPDTNKYDDINGQPSGHFVVLNGIDLLSRLVDISDPFQPNPMGVGLKYQVPLDRLICAILLGVVTYDANLLILTPKNNKN